MTTLLESFPLTGMETFGLVWAKSDANDHLLESFPLTGMETWGIEPSQKRDNDTFGIFSPHGDGNSWVGKPALAGRTLLESFPLTGMETKRKRTKHELSSYLLESFPLTGMETGNQSKKS